MNDRNITKGHQPSDSSGTVTKVESFGDADALSPEAPMPSYKLYCMQSEGNLHFAEWIEAKDDAEAVSAARRLKKDAMKCEVWHGQRLVAVLDAAELAA